MLSGKTILTSSGLVTGSMTNNGSISQTLNAGGSYTIPKGYHDGTGKVTANTLSSQTSATAVASNLLSGKTAYVNWNKITGTMANKSGATVSATTVTESGTNALISIPTAGYYDTNSKLSVPINEISNKELSLTIKNNCQQSINGTIGSSVENTEIDVSNFTIAVLSNVTATGNYNGYVRLYSLDGATAISNTDNITLNISNNNKLLLTSAIECSYAGTMSFTVTLK